MKYTKRGNYKPGPDGLVQDEDGNYWLNLEQTLLMILHAEQTPAARRIASTMRQVYDAARAGRFVERSIEILPHEASDAEKVVVRVFAAWIRGQLTLRDPVDVSGLPERPPADKAGIARWKLAGRDIDAAQRAWGILDQFIAAMRK